MPAVLNPELSAGWSTAIPRKSSFSFLVHSSQCATESNTVRLERSSSPLSHGIQVLQAASLPFVGFMGWETVLCEREGSRDGCRLVGSLECHVTAAGGSCVVAERCLEFLCLDLRAVV